MEKIEGLIAAPFTPFDAKGEVNVKMAGPYAALLARNGVAGAFVCGTTGEGHSLSLEERLKLAEAWIEEAPKGFKVMVHAGANALPDVKAILRHAKKSGAHSAALLAPSYFKAGNVSALVDYCQEAASAAPELPVYYYHIPSMTGCAFAMREFLELADGRIPNLAGVKFTYENVMDYSECLELMGGKYEMLFGRDEMLLCALPLGAKGAIGSTFNFAAPLYVRMIEAWKAGDLGTAKELQVKSHRMLRALFGIGSSPLSTFKAIMKELGADCGEPRLPLPRLRPEQKEALLKALAEIGFESFRCR